jgi:hypothetical protein
MPMTNLKPEEYLEKMLSLTTQPDWLLYEETLESTLAGYRNSLEHEVVTARVHHIQGCIEQLKNQLNFRAGIEAHIGDA